MLQSPIFKTHRLWTVRTVREKSYPKFSETGHPLAILPLPFFLREQNIALPRHGNIVSEANGRTDLVNKYFNLENVLLKQ